MYKELVNKQVLVIVSSQTEMLLEYRGILVEDDEKNIKLKNTSINIAMLNFQKNFFGSNIGNYKKNISEVIVNKKYITINFPTDQYKNQNINVLKEIIDICMYFADKNYYIVFVPHIFIDMDFINKVLKNAPEDMWSLNRIKR